MQECKRLKQSAGWRSWSGAISWSGPIWSYTPRRHDGPHSETANFFCGVRHNGVACSAESAQSALKGAYNDRDHAGGEWGSHRVKAMDHIKEALAELNEAEKWGENTATASKVQTCFF